MSCFRTSRLWQPCLFALLGSVAVLGDARADVFTYVDREGDEVTVEARLAGSGQQMHALELADGSFRLVPQRSVLKRKAAPGPEPIDADEMIERLTEQFGQERFRAYDEAPYVVGVVLSAPLPSVHETRVNGLLRRAARFMRRVESKFLSFARYARFPTAPVRYPLVLLIFESDEDFERYATEVVGRNDVSAENIAGFYSAITNHLAIRLTECADFAVPLHEAIHQQVFNRGVLERLAPIPAWFNEGIATGFQGNGDRIDVSPNKINSRYAALVPRANQVDWATVVTDDRVFQTDVLAGPAYVHAWSLHWLLVTEYKIPYTNYVKLLAAKETLDTYPAEERRQDFESTFDASIEQLQKEFAKSFPVARKRQRIRPPRKPRAGYSVSQDNLGEVQLKAIRRLDLGGALFVQGSLKNISPIREMSFYVTVETTGGLYTGWQVPSLGIGRSTKLKLQQVDKLMRGARGGPASSFYVRVHSAPAGSEKARKWKAGQLPLPVFGGAQ